MANLLVGAEADAKTRVRQLGMGGQARDERHDLGDACLVVGAEQGRAVGHHKVFARECVERGKLIGRDRDGALGTLAADEGASLVMYDMRVHVGAAHNFGSVEVGDEAERGALLGAGAGRHVRDDIGVVGHVHALAPKLGKLIGKHARKVELLVS